MNFKYLHIIIFALLCLQIASAQKNAYWIILSYSEMSHDSISIVLNKDTVFQGRQPNDWNSFIPIEISKDKLLKNNQLEIIFFTLDNHKFELTQTISLDNKQIYKTKKTILKVDGRMLKKYNLLLTGGFYYKTYIDFTKKKFAPSEG